MSNNTLTYSYIRGLIQCVAKSTLDLDINRAKRFVKELEVELLPRGYELEGYVPYIYTQYGQFVLPTVDTIEEALRVITELPPLQVRESKSTNYCVRVAYKCEDHIYTNTVLLKRFKRSGVY